MCIRNWLKSLIITLALTLSWSSSASAQTYEEKFQDIFITAGYATAFGAALGAASLGLSTNPEKKLDYVAIGASLGFIGGALMGMYIVFQPVMLSEDQRTEDLLAQHRDPKRLYVHPYINKKSGKVSGMAGSWTLATF